MTNCNNSDVRQTARDRGVALWRIALELGISEMTLTRWLRVELSPEKRARIMDAISKLSSAKLEERG